MKKFLFTILSIYFFNQVLTGQQNEIITVKAGTKILDSFPIELRYIYPEFKTGKVVFKNGIFSERRLNLNFLLGEMEFIQSRDTLTIINKKDIKYVAIAQDTFYYDKGYIKQMSKGKHVIGLKERFELKEVQNKDPYGVSSSASSTTSFGTMPVDGNFYKLNANKDMVFQRVRQFYLTMPGREFVLLSRKSLVDMFPSDETKIKAFLKTNKIKFDKTDDILKLSDFLNTLDK